MICPDCNGQKVMVFSHLSYAGGGHGWNVPMPCTRCDASGEVPDAMADWIVRGKAMRDRRVDGKPYRSLREEAQRRGIDVTLLSKMEVGKIEPVEDAT